MATLGTSFRESVLSRMAELGITQRELARRLGCSSPNISQMLNRTNPTADLIERVARALEAEPVISFRAVREKVSA